MKFSQLKEHRIDSNLQGIFANINLMKREVAHLDGQNMPREERQEI
jgi:hypothetical protein